MVEIRKILPPDIVSELELVGKETDPKQESPELSELQQTLAAIQAAKERPPLKRPSGSARVCAQMEANGRQY